MTILSNKAVVIRFNKEFLEEGNVDVLEEIIADDFINHTAEILVPDNLEGLKQFIGRLHKGFSDIYIDIHKQIGENDLVATSKTIRATHTGEIMGHLPTGKQVAFKVMDFVRIRNGKYIGHWEQNNIIQVIKELL
jgi:predicted ester cyclase